jgi:hypothetical protein
VTARAVPIVIGVALLALLGWGVTAVLERLTQPDPPPPAPVTEAPPAAETPHISATLFFASADGSELVPLRREVALAEGLEAQGRQIVSAQLAAEAPQPYVSVIPAGTTLRGFFVTDRGDAFVDLSPEISSAHPGGSLTELLTVQAIVHAVTANLPAVQRVQILVNGAEVDTIAGHVDVRRPLARDESLLMQETAP